jgi:hypothetical protein
VVGCPDLPVAFVGIAGTPTQAQGLEIVKGKAFDSGVVRDFYLEGERDSDAEAQRRDAQDDALPPAGPDHDFGLDEAGRPQRPRMGSRERPAASSTR